ncbi:MAG TPA: glycosyltransferase family 1 protein [Candidatus Saccharimonadales bacterium]|nr:glycosyltransferase family 1 protein [Candidatus Saccharimonadales bacterium]
MATTKTKLFIEAIPLTRERLHGVAHSLLGTASTIANDSDFKEHYEIILVAPKQGLSRLDRFPELKDCRRIALPFKTRVFNGLVKYGLLPPMDQLLGRGIYLFGDFKNWPLTKRSVALTYIHDISHVLFPEFVEPKNQRMLQRNTPRFIRQTDYIITVSENSKREIAEHYHIDPARILVLYNGVDRKLYRPYSSKEIVKVKKIYGITKPYFLYVGNIEPRKNLVRLVEAFEKLPKTMSLVLIGGSGWLDDPVTRAVTKARRRGVSIVKPTSYVSDEEIAVLTSGATAFVHPSLHEGFGMDPVQGMAAGVPVLASDIPVLREVLGDGATYFDPTDTEAITEALQSALKLTDAQKEKRAKKSMKRSDLYAWGLSAKKLYDFLKTRKQSTR